MNYSIYQQGQIQPICLHSNPAGNWYLLQRWKSDSPYNVQLKKCTLFKDTLIILFF